MVSLCVVDTDDTFNCVDLHFDFEQVIGIKKI